MLDLLEKLGIADNMMVNYSTDNGAETVSWPDGGNTPFHGQKGTTWDSGICEPAMVHRPGVLKPGTVVNEILSFEDWIPTIMAAVAGTDIKEELEAGIAARANSGKSIRRVVRKPLLIPRRGDELSERLAPDNNRGLFLHLDA